MLDGVDGITLLDELMDFLSLQPDEVSLLPPEPQRTAFVAHRFDERGEQAMDKLARFLGLLGFAVITGRAYSPKSIADKVRSRMEQQAIVFVILTPGDDATWLVQESAIAKIQGKPLFLLKETSAEFKSGILADHEYIPFENGRVESCFVPILEGMREIGYATE